nr:putative F-box protein At3g52320 [Ipomoea batatas]
MSNRGEWSSSSSLPDDIIAEILSWLPVVSILRFKSICKTWRRIIEQDDELMEKHRHRAGAATCFSYQYKHMRRLGDVFVSSRFQTEKRVEFWCIDTQKGLVLEKDRGRTELGERLRIRNPATRQAVYLPVVAGNWTVAGMFFVGKSCCKIYALSIGHVFYVVIMDTEPKKILSVDSKNESCKSGEIPETLFSDWSNVMPREWDSKLCLYSQDGENNINIWVLQNDEEWAKTSIVVDYPVPFPFIAEDAKLKGMEAMPQEAIDNRPYWKEEDFVGLIPSSQIISLLSLLLST